MFQSEHLQEKWAPLLDYDGLDKIEDSHKRSVTAVLLENQEKFLRDEQSFQQGGSLLSEQPTNYGNAAGNPTGNPATTAGFGANATTPVAGFDPVLISLIRRSMPNLVAYDLAGVQPMSGPTGLIFAMRSRYTSRTGTEAFYNEADSAFSGQDAGFDNTGGMANATVGLGTTVQSGTNPSVLNPTATATSTDYNVGEGMATGDAESLDGTGNSAFNQMAYSLKTLRPFTVLTLKQNLLTS